MPDQPQEPVTFTSADHLLDVITYPPTPHPTTGEPVVKVEFQPRWITSSIPEPLEVALEVGPDVSVQRSYEDGSSIDGTVRLCTTPSGHLAVLVNLEYGDMEQHELDGVVALVSNPN